MHLIFPLIFIILGLGYYLKNFLKAKSNRFYKNRFNINNWMLMNKDQRKLIDHNDQLESMLRKKNLLKKIRREYLEHTRKNI